MVGQPFVAPAVEPATKEGCKDTDATTMGSGDTVTPGNSNG